MQRRLQKDPIAEHSGRLCEYINNQPAVALSYARYFGEYPTANKATMASIDQNGFDVVCIDQGEEHEIRVTFKHSLHALSQARDELMSLAKEAETALRGNDSNSQGLMPDSPSATLPDLDAFAVMLLSVALVVVYLDRFPNTTSPLLQWIQKMAGASLIHYISVLLVTVHLVESLVSMYFTAVVGQGFFQPIDIFQWAFIVLIFGYPSLFSLISLARRQQKAAREAQAK
ncbi:hypothetical protein FBU30_007422 [Linnemannia zychae]|nr:hypothetical protein FBU30_007422 [Linnemannia zychae]